MMDIPPLGLGTWPLTGPDATRAVLSGIEAGYRLVDTATIYDNEDAVGVALAECGLPREELFVTTKLRGSDHVSGDIRGAVERSLKNLGLDRLDLFLIHWPLPRHDRYVAAFEAMLACRDAGLVRYVGVSNFLETHLRRVVTETGEAPAVNQIQMDPSLARLPVRRANDELGVLTQSWSPLGRGDVLGASVVTDIARRLDHTPAQVVLAWHFAHSVVPVARSANPARQAENLAALDVRLTAADVDALNRLDRGESAARDVETEEHY
ncbi:diketogulonate reductase-like aldo/keto reductase [Rhodococcus wratislaviensis]|uniref:2,5-didehydrogluconate reductase n=3 Tax=Rhodococcus TaxID=1827 RepID=A0AB38FLL8_RHOWR|nr:MULTISPECIES: aldo/keto reductase [Rhodococcus]AII09326.1 2,5-didehydrogluconate reductase [Rhodococcus opacus]REE76376.1 diketogulonate reductase-like aldo/keto reductase [Rhodococcus wratislaviensis]GAF48423.1 putative aldo-keto reductase [Rhodococcus wratislaviensis NBRC 100605]SPZ42497.1 2,5-didehydrogluconate reductase [Rhodococcus wratislaviensis]